MLPKAKRLTHSKDFKRLSTQGRSVFGPFATMRVRQAHEQAAKVAFITSTKVFKLAVDRNRVKRRMRHVLAEIFLELPKSVHLIFILKPEALKATHEALIAEARRLIGKIPEALKQPPKLSPRAIKEREKRQRKTHGNNS